MRSLLRGVRSTILAALIALGVLAVFLPGNTDPGEGPSDPILELRRPVIAFLREAGLAKTPVFILPDPWLPSEFRVDTQIGNRGGEDRLVATEEIRREPVYRGLFWRIGTRIQCTARGFDHYRRLRLSVVRAGGQTVYDGRHPREAGAPLDVEGFVPNDADGWRLDGVDGAGTAHEMRSEWRTASP